MLGQFVYDDHYDLFIDNFRVFNYEIPLKPHLVFSTFKLFMFPLTLSRPFLRRCSTSS